MADWVSAGNGLMQGMQFGYGIARMKKRDEVEQQRFDEAMDYRQDRDAVADQRYSDQNQYARGRDQVADTRYKEGVDYARGRDQVADQRSQQEFGLRQKVQNAQLRNYDQQYEQSQAEYQNSIQLRKLGAIEHLLKNGTDNGQLAALLNEDPQYSSWLQSRGLADAKFNSLRMNETGKGEPGVITVLEGKDKATGEKRLGVATVNASSDPDDPVAVMPMHALGDMVLQATDDAEAAGDPERAEAVRKLFLERIQAQKIALGGAAPKPGWGRIQNVSGVGPGQYDGEGQFHQLEAVRGYGVPGARGRGGSSKDDNSRLSQVYKQMSAVFQDDPDQQVDNSELRDLSISLAQDFDLQTGGALAPGVYAQVAKEASQGLALSRGAAEQKAIEELNQGKFAPGISGYDPEDEEVQQRADAIMQREKARYADSYMGALSQMAGARTGGGGLPAAGEPSAQQNQAPQSEPASLDDAVGAMIESAKAKGATISAEQAREYLTQKYPDRFGSGVAGEPNAEPSQEAPRPQSWGEIADNSVDKRAVRAVKGAAEGAVDATARGMAKLKSYGAKSVAQNRFSKALTMGQKPTVQNLSEWMPHLEGPDREQALAIMSELYPDDQLTQKALREYNHVAAR